MKVKEPVVVLQQGLQDSLVNLSSKIMGEVLIFGSFTEILSVPVSVLTTEGRTELFFPELSNVLWSWKTPAP